MFHLFNKVYMKHESLYDSSTAGLIICAEKSQHPISRIMGIETAPMPTFEEILKEKFDNNTENLWKGLLEIDSNTKFNLIVDSKLLNQFVIQYWKSIFKNPEPEAILKLYNFFTLDVRLKSFIYSDLKLFSRSHLKKSISFLTKEEFTELYEKTPMSEVLRSSKKDKIGFEYLLVDYFCSEEEKYARGFKEKVRSLAWKRWINDTELLKADIINDFYNIKKISENIHLSLDSISEIELQIQNDPNLNWMLDENFNQGNFDYIRRNYDKEIFLILYKKMYMNWHEKDIQDKNFLSIEGFSDDQMALTNLVYEENFDSFLQKDIQRGFGCFLTSDHLRQKSNQIFVSYIYDKIRSKQTEDLKQYELA